MIIVFGSINIDLVFRTSKLPAEGETVLTDSFLTLPGGKGANQAVAAARASALEAGPVMMAGCIGQDAFADLALAELRAARVDLAMLKPVGRPTGCATITVDCHGRNQITVASGANLDTVHALVNTSLLQQGTFVLLQNEVGESENLALARKAVAHGASVIMNAAPARPILTSDWAGLLSVLIVNEMEAQAIAGSASLDALFSLAQTLRATVVATLGAQGALAVTPDGSSHHVNALPLESVVDTTGAGDTFVGALAAALHDGLLLPEALHFATVAGSLACTTMGAQASAPHRTEILVRLRGFASTQLAENAGGTG
jgi:ribokinase